MSKDSIEYMMTEIVKAIIKEDKYRVISPEQIKELAIEILTKALTDLETKEKRK